MHQTEMNHRCIEKRPKIKFEKRLKTLKTPENKKALET